MRPAGTALNAGGGIDIAAGAFSRVSLGASELGAYPGWMAHSMAAEGGVAFRVVVKRKIAGNELIEQGTGAPLW